MSATGPTLSSTSQPRVSPRNRRAANRRMASEITWSHGFRARESSSMPNSCSIRVASMPVSSSTCGKLRRASCQGPGGLVVTDCAAGPRRPARGHADGSLCGRYSQYPERARHDDEQCADGRGKARTGRDSPGVSSCTPTCAIQISHALFWFERIWQRRICAAAICEVPILPAPILAEPAWKASS